MSIENDENDYFRNNLYYKKPPRHSIHQILKSINTGQTINQTSSHIYNIKSLLQSVSTPQTSNVISKENSLNIGKQDILEKFCNIQQKNNDNTYSLGNSYQIQIDKNSKYQTHNNEKDKQTNTNQFYDINNKDQDQGYIINSNPRKLYNLKPPMAQRNNSDRTRYEQNLINANHEYKQYSRPQSKRRIQHSSRCDSKDDSDNEQEQNFIIKYSQKTLQTRELSQKMVKKQVSRHSFQHNNSQNNDSSNHVHTQMNTSSYSQKSSLPKRSVLRDITNLQQKEYKYKLENNTKPEQIKKFENPAPQVSARSWALFDGLNNKLIDGKSQYSQREIASLTKIMTFWASLKILEKLQIDMNQVHLQVTRFASSVNGTSADLREGQVLNLVDLFYGLMLPSGNDAALVLAENLGFLLQLQIKFENFSPEQKIYFLQKNVYDQEQFHKKLLKSVNPIYTFIGEMNRQARELSLCQTIFANSHGLSNKNNKSTAHDVAKLCCTVMKDEFYSKVVSTQTHTCTIINEYDQPEKITWKNTNKLLGRSGWEGVKTGITDPAGPCLASCYFQNSKRYILVLLNSKSMDIRWEESEKIVQWSVKNPPKDFRNT